MYKYVLQVISLVVILQHCNTQNVPVIKIKNGHISGSILRTFDKNVPYLSFLGIPYAKPPIGDLRFRQSEPPDNWQGVLNATREKDICTQTITTVYGTTEVRGSEDCLYLNVFTPVLANQSHSRLPVMFFIHGGGFQEGSNAFDEYGPDLFIDNGVILITIKYRLGVYGFLSTGDAASPGNNGLKDQLLALKWTKENIKSFGGDPNKVTIFGHSAGAACVGYFLLSALSKGLFRAAIMQSASQVNGFARQMYPVEKAFELGRRFEINTNNSVELVNRLRFINNTKSLFSTANVVADMFNNLDGSFAKFGPVVEYHHKNAFIIEKPLNMLHANDFHKVPIIIGHTTLEAVYFSQLVEGCTAAFSNNITRLVPDTLVPEKSTIDQVAAILKGYYFKNTTGGFYEFDIQRFVSDNMFVKGILKASRLFARGTSVRQYTFGYIGNAGGSDPNRKGTGHTEELNYLFHKVSESQEISSDDNRIRQDLAKMWTDFAKTGDPTPTSSGGLKWPKLDEKTQYKSLLINKTYMVRTRENEENIKFWDDLYRKYDTGRVGWF